jgi:hypothetical protein
MSELTGATLDDPAPLDEATALSPEWLTAALRVRWPEVVVGGVEVVERNQGMATKIRIRVDCGGGEAGVPEALCVKGYFGWPADRLAGVQPETIFYREMAADLDVRTPGCVHAAIDPATGHGLLIMEDLLAAGATFLSALAPFSVEQSAATLDQLARLHAAWWDQSVEAVPDGLGPRGSFGALGDPEFIQSQLDDGRAAGVPAEVRRGDRLAQAMAALTGGGIDAPRCLVHGDTHVGNLYETADGRIGIADWQVLHYGPWAIDVAYHVATALETDERRRSERDLLAHYLDRLADQGVTPPGWDEAWHAYRVCLPYGYFMWAITRLVERPIIDRLTHRLGTAVADHGSFDLLGV